jgi:LPXTG-site transpeptidase (sortase) family protein
MQQLDSVGLDLDQVKTVPRLNKPPLAVSWLWNLAFIVFFSLVIFFAINFPAFYRMYQYYLRPQAFADSSLFSVCPGPKSSVQYSDNTLIIGKISVRAPIKWDVGSADVMGTLNTNLAHIAGTGKPGEGKNIFITGHSSNYWWSKGELNTVFALLPKLETGDEIYITYKGEFFRYRVTQKIEVSKSDVQNYVSSDKEKLTLMTCVPVGTNLRRLLVIAEPL